MGKTSGASSPSANRIEPIPRPNWRPAERCLDAEGWTPSLVHVRFSSVSQTFKHHATRTTGILLALGSTPFLVAFGIFAVSLGNIPFGILTGVAGLGLASGVALGIIGHRGLGKERRRRAEKMVIAEIARRHGRITTGELAAATTLDLEESRTILQRLCDIGEGEMQVLPGGKFLYVFDDFLPLDQKEAARDPFRDPLNDLVVE